MLSNIGVSIEGDAQDPDLGKYLVKLWWSSWVHLPQIGMNIKNIWVATTLYINTLIVISPSKPQPQEEEQQQHQQQ